MPPATTGAESSVGNCTKESLLRDSSCAVAKTLSTCWFQQDRALTEYTSHPSTRSCQSTQPSSFCNFGFPAPLLSLLSCGGARLSAPFRLLPSVYPQAKECCTSSLGRTGWPREAHSLNTYELAPSAIEVPFEARFVAEQMIKTEW